jgi:hypothetical protein
MASKSQSKHKSNQQHKSSTQSKSGSSSAKGGPAHKKAVRKERGFWLTAALVLMVVTGLAAAIFYNAAKTPQVDRTWILTMMVIANLGDVLAALGIWFWKRWGLYVYLFATGLAFVAGLASVGMWASFYLILPAVIVGWLLRSKWQYFEEEL